MERGCQRGGDNRGTAEAIGRETGVDEVRAELLPAEKVAAIGWCVSGPLQAGLTVRRQTRANPCLRITLQVSGRRVAGHICSAVLQVKYRLFRLIVLCVDGGDLVIVATGYVVGGLFCH
jgi:hypothetical protein